MAVYDVCSWPKTDKIASEKWRRSLSFYSMIYYSYAKWSDPKKGLLPYGWAAYSITLTRKSSAGWRASADFARQKAKLGLFIHKNESNGFHWKSQRKSKSKTQSFCRQRESKQFSLPLAPLSRLQLQQVAQLLLLLWAPSGPCFPRPAVPVASGGSHFPPGEQLISRSRCRRRRQKAGNTFDRRAGKAERRPEMFRAARRSSTEIFTFFQLAFHCGAARTSPGIFSLLRGTVLGTKVFRFVFDKNQNVPLKAPRALLKTNDCFDYMRRSDNILARLSEWVWRTCKLEIYSKTLRWALNSSPGV